jgi:hypothetical protein
MARRTPSPVEIASQRLPAMLGLSTCDLPGPSFARSVWDYAAGPASIMSGSSRGRKPDGTSVSRHCGRNTPFVDRDAQLLNRSSILAYPMARIAMGSRHLLVVSNHFVGKPTSTSVIQILLSCGVRQPHILASRAGARSTARRNRASPTPLLWNHLGSGRARAYGDRGRRWHRDGRNRAGCVARASQGGRNPPRACDPGRAARYTREACCASR